MTIQHTRAYQATGNVPKAPLASVGVGLFVDELLDYKVIVSVRVTSQKFRKRGAAILEE